MKIASWLPFLMRYDRWLLWIGIPLFAAALHWNAWSLELTGPHVWRQTQTQQTIDSFVEEDFSILNPRHLDRGAGDGIQRLEFPLYQWLVAAAGKVLGNTVFLTRILTFLICCCGIWGMHALLLAWSGNRMTALLAAYATAFSPVVFYYGVTPLPDMLPFTLGVWSMALSLRALDGGRPGNWALGMALAGVATLLKLPYAIFLLAPGVAALLLLRRKAIGLGGFAAAVVIGILAVAPAVAWYRWVMPSWGASGALGGLFTEDWEWPQLWALLQYHITEMYPRTLMSVAALPLFVWGCYQMIRQRRTQGVGGMAWVLAPVFLSFLAFSIYELQLINRWHDYYMLPAVPFLMMPIAVGAGHLISMKRILPVLIATGLLLLIPYMCYRRIAPRWLPENAEFNRDLLLHQTGLRQAVPDNALVVAGPDVSHNIFLYYIHKKGWSWDANQTFDAAKLQSWHDEGAQYLYCDDRAYDSLPEIQALLGDTVGNFGTVRIYRLR